MTSYVKFCAAAVFAFPVCGLSAYGQDVAVESETIEVTGTLTSNAAERSDVAAIEEEIQIMAKVLEESIDHAGIEDWKSMSVGRLPAFDGAFGQFNHVHSRYIPTVGVIFTVPVAFPLRSSATYSEDEPKTEPDDSDLWKKHQKSSARYQVRFNRATASTGDDGAVRIVQTEPVVIRETIVTKSENSKSGLHNETEITQPNGGIAFGGGGGGGIGIGGGGGGGGIGIGGGGFAISGGRAAHVAFVQQEFNQEKVDTLRKTLIETLAEYGHRIEHLPADERLLVIVESPVHGFAGGIVPLFETIYRGEETGNIPQVRSAARYQISVRKQDLSASATADSLKDSIEETEY